MINLDLFEKVDRLLSIKEGKEKKSLRIDIFFLTFKSI